MRTATEIPQEEVSEIYRKWQDGMLIKVIAHEHNVIPSVIADLRARHRWIKRSEARADVYFNIRVSRTIHDALKRASLEQGKTRSLVARNILASNLKFD